MRSLVFVSVCAAALAGCGATPLAQPPASAQPVRLFGPVISQEVIRGREEAGQEVLLLVDRTIVRLNLEERRASSTAVAVAPGEACWGLGRLDDGSLWSLKGRDAVIRIETDGRVSRQIALTEPHAGLFAFGDRLVVQKAGASPPEPALRAGVPGSESWAPWSDLRIRSFPGIDRVQGMALSLVACGRSRVTDRACWFPDEAAVAVISPDGRTRRVMLSGLATTTPEALLTAENPRRPVRDAYIDERQRLWILSTGDAPAPVAHTPGGWILARYSSDGTPDGIVSLTEPVRLILRVEGRRVIVLTGSGYVSEIASW